MSIVFRARIASAFVLMSLVGLGTIYTASVIFAAIASFALGDGTVLAFVLVCLCGLFPLFDRALGWLARLDEWAIETIEAARLQPAEDVVGPLCRDGSHHGGR